MKSVFTFLLVSVFTPLSFAVCVSANLANLRSKPTTKSKVTWVVGKYMPLLEVGRKGAWMRVKDMDGRHHWIHRKLVSYGFNCAAVRASKANLRKGPSTRKKKTLIGSVRKYATFRKLDRDDAWLKLRDDYGYTHWAHESTLWEPKHRTSVTF